MEGVIQNVKQQPDRWMDCDEPALYFNARWKDLRASHRTFVADLEKMNDIVANCKENSHANQLAEEGKEHETEYSKMNDAFMTEDAVWDTGATGKKAEFNLRRKLEACFTRKLGKTTYKKCHKVMKEYIVDAGVGNMRGMEYKTFTEWMGNRRVTKKCISAGVMRGIEDFIKNWESEDQCTE